MVGMSGSSESFETLARRAFSFLEMAGFRVEAGGPGTLKYSTPHAFVKVEWEQRSGELNVFLGLQSSGDENGEPPFSLTDLLRMEHTASSSAQPFQVSDVRRLEPFLEKLAEDTRAHAQAALDGDRMFFRRLEIFRGAQAKLLTNEMRSRHLRAKAERAWKMKKFDEVVTLYGVIEDLLTDGEMAKLNYARKHQSS
jgi:hypothetical protein